MSLVHTFYFPLVFSRWCDQCELRVRFIGRFMISDHKDSSLPKKKDPKKDHLPWQHHVLMFLVLQTASSPSFAQKSVREESIWVAKSRELRRRARSLLVLKKIEETCTTATRSSGRRKEQKQHKLHMNMYVSLWNTNVCPGLKQNRIHVRIIKLKKI